MGYNTAVSICNDGLDQIKKHPAEFVQGILDNIRGGNYGVGNHGGIVNVIESDHADATQLIAVGGNFSIKLHTAWFKNFHTEEGQIGLLKSWADSLGYQVSKKPVKK